MTLAKEILPMLIRYLLVFLGANGITADALDDAAIAKIVDVLLLVGPILWAIWKKVVERRVLLTALETNGRVSEKAVRQMVKRGGGPPVISLILIALFAFSAANYERLTNLETDVRRRAGIAEGGTS